MVIERLHTLTQNMYPSATDDGRPSSSSGVVTGTMRPSPYRSLYCSRGYISSCERGGGEEQGKESERGKERKEG
jgi:hypothetical protein